MRVRFWKAWALAAGFVTASVFAPTLFGQEAAPAAEAKAKPKDARGAESSKPKGRTIELQLAVSAGTGAKGCKIEVKPANPTCQFETQTIEVPAGGSRAVERKVTLKDVEIRGADRNVAIAITIREGDGTTKTVYRGYRVAAEPKAGEVERFICWMSAPSRTASVAAEPAASATRR